VAPIALLTLLTSAAGSNAGSEPLAMADQGWVQCHEPNDVSKTCQSIAAYKRNGDGSWNNIALVLLSPTQPLTLETVTTVREENGAVCGYIRQNDIMNGKLRQSGQPMPSAKAIPVLRKVAEGMAPLMDRKICTEYEQAPTDLIARARIEGGNFAIPDQRVKWVLPSEGYRVAPGAPL
jgi:hypothetical protein